MSGAISRVRVPAFALLTLGGAGEAVAATARSTPLDPPAGPGALAPSLVAVPGGVLLTWVERSPEGAPAVQRLRLSVLRGEAWGPASTIAESPTLIANWADFPTVGIAGDGAWIARWARSAPGGDEASEVVVSRSDDAGRTWRLVGPLHDDRTPTEHGFASLLAEGQGVQAIWLDGRATLKGGPTALRTTRVGRKVEAGAVLDDRVCDCCGTALARTSEGLIVAYRDRLEGEIRDLSVVRQMGGRWSEPVTVHRDGWKTPGCPVNGPAMGARGRDVAIAWYTAAQNHPRVQVAFSGDAGATFDPPLAVDADRPMGQVALALEPTGDALVVWLGERGTVRLRRLSRAGGAGETAELAQLPAVRTSGFPRLALRGEDVLVAWTEPEKPSHVRVVRLAAADIPAAVRAATPAAQVPRPGGFDPLTARAFDLAGAPADVRALAGTPADVEPRAGGVLVVNLWATWCAPCRRELPVLSALQRQYGPRGVQVVGLSADDDAAALTAFVGHRALAYPVLRLASAPPPAAVVPTTWVFSPDGRLAWHHEGELSADDASLRAVLDALLPAVEKP